jgi:hypothetical protein
VGRLAASPEVDETWQEVGGKKEKEEGCKIKG